MISLLIFRKRKKATNWEIAFSFERQMKPWKYLSAHKKINSFYTNDLSSWKHKYFPSINFIHTHIFFSLSLPIFLSISTLSTTSIYIFHMKHIDSDIICRWSRMNLSWLGEGSEADYKNFRIAIQEINYMLAIWIGWR